MGVAEEIKKTREAKVFLKFNDIWRESTKGLFVVQKICEKIKDVDKYHTKLEGDEEFRAVVSGLGQFYETLGVAVKAGFMDIHLVALTWAGATRMYWENIMEPVIEDMRKMYNYPSIGSETEYVCRKLIRYMDEHPELKT